jgi:hypothetical protein
VKVWFYGTALFWRAEDERTLRQLCNDFVNGKMSDKDVKHYDFNDAEGRGQRKKFPSQQDEDSEDDDLPLRNLLVRRSDISTCFTAISIINSTADLVHPL